MSQYTIKKHNKIVAGTIKKTILEGMFKLIISPLSVLLKNSFIYNKAKNMPEEIYASQSCIVLIILNS